MRKGIDWTIIGERSTSFLDHFLASPKWSRQSLIALFLGVVSLVIPVFVIYRSFFGNLDLMDERSWLVTFLLFYCFLHYPVGRKSWDGPLNRWFVVDLTLLLMIIAQQAYMSYGLHVHETTGLSIQAFGADIRWDYIVGTVVILLCFEATRRSFGWIMVALPLFFIAYCFLAEYFPGPLRSGAVGWPYMLEVLYILPDGVYGLGTDVLLSMLCIYLIFGSFVVATKVGCVFQALATGFTGTASGGPAKASVIASSLFGMVSGSAVANVAAVGSITIPMMKKIGYEPKYAAAIEATASTGGQIMPPVMGATAFLIAAYTQIPYWKICIMAFLPAVLYYVGIFVQVHLSAKRLGLGAVKPDDVPSVIKSLAQGGHMLIPLALLVTVLAMGRSVGFAGAVGIASVLVFSFIIKETRQDPRSIVSILQQSTKANMGIYMCLVMVGILLGAMTSTGLGVKIAYLVQALSQGNLTIALFITAIICLILGTSIGTPVIYLLCVGFAIPTLIDLGCPVMVAHLFCFYMANSAHITPPYCIASFTAAAVAGSNPMATGWKACQVGIAAFLVPIVFVSQPALLILGGDWSILSVLYAFVIAAICLFAFGIAIEGWLLAKVDWASRVMVFSAGVLLALPSIPLKVAGFCLFAAMILLHIYRFHVVREKILNERY